MKYQMRASAAEPTVQEVLVYDFIGDWIDGMFGFGVTANSFIQEIAAMPESVKTIRVRVNSPGGDVFSAVAIANVLRDQRMTKGRKIEMFVDGLAASAASLVIMAGDTISMADNGLVMVHDAWTVKQGNSRDLRDEAERLDKLRDAAIVPTYQWHVKLSAAAILDLMAKETWMNADEAVALGFATEKVEGLRAAAALDLSRPVQLSADPRHAEALAALLAFPPKKEEETPAPAPAEETPAPAPAEETKPEPKEPKDLLEDLKDHLKEGIQVVEQLADGTASPDEPTITSLMEHLTLAQEAADAMPPLPKPKKEEAPKEEAKPADAPPAPAEENPKAVAVVEVKLDATAALEQIAAATHAVEESVVPATLVKTVAAGEVLRRCVDQKLSLAFASSLYGADLTEEELTLRIGTEVSRLEAESTREAAVRAMFKKHSLETIGDLVAGAGVGVAAAGRLVTELKALKESVEVDGALAPTVGRGRKVLSYREAMDRVNSPFKKE